VQIQKLGNTILIDATHIKDNEKIVDKLNNLITLYLTSNNLISDSTQIQRAGLFNGIINISSHATFNTDKIIELLSKITKSDIIECDIYSTLTQEHKNKLPNQFVLNGTQAGGVTSDETGIDPRIKVFCESLNSIPNIETFSSCDGHDISYWYVLFACYDDKISTLDSVLELIVAAYKQTYFKYGEDVKQIFQMQTLCGTNNWVNLDGTKRNFLRSNIEYKGAHFEVRAKVNNAELFYKITNEFSNNFKELIKDKKW